jgi:hypothetical protein
MRWITTNTVPLLNIIGIILDITGAFFVAMEVVKQFRGAQYGGQIAFDRDFSSPPVETPQYKTWNRIKMRLMKIGLACLVLGFLFQLLANVLQFKNAP